MGYWEQADQPFYYSLASVFPVADRYFSSVPGQTYPNRRAGLQRVRAGNHPAAGIGLPADWRPSGLLTNSFSRGLNYAIK
jgi:phospholipase C